LRDVCSREFYDGAKLGNYLSYTEYPVLRVPVNAPREREWAHTKLFDIQSDYPQETNLVGRDIESAYQALLVETMKKMGAPNWQFERIGLAADPG
jgi:hypothetical protein